MLGGLYRDSHLACAKLLQLLGSYIHRILSLFNVVNIKFNQSINIYEVER